MAGLTENGFEKKTLQEIKTEIEDFLRSVFGAFINLLPGSVFATLIGIFAERESLLWDLLEEIYNAMYPGTAAGVNLDNAVGFNGITRLGATFSVVPGFLLFGDVATLIPAGTQFSVEENPAAVFESDEDVTLIAGVNEIQQLVFGSVPDAGSFTITYRGETTAAIAFNDNAAAVKAALELLDGIDEVTVTGDFSTGFTIEFEGENGLQPQDLVTANSSLTDSAVPVAITVSQDQAGVAQGTVSLTATSVGPTDAPIGTLTVIDTPVSGLNRVDNPSSTVLGRFIETDAELRERRENTLTVAGNSTPEAIRSKLLNVEGVTDAFIFENESLTTDGDGRPGKSYEAVVAGGDDQDVADTIWGSKPAGIETHGDQTENVIDSTGVTRQVKFSRPGDIPIFVSIDLTVDNALFPSNGAALAQAAIVTWGNSLGIGQDVIIYPQLVAQLNSIPGILDMRIRIDDSAVSTTPNDPAVDDNISIDASDVSEFSNANTDINIL